MTMALFKICRYCDIVDSGNESWRFKIAPDSFPNSFPEACANGSADPRACPLY
jgi:hypothetical protein